MYQAWHLGWLLHQPYSSGYYIATEHSSQQQTRLPSTLFACWNSLSILHCCLLDLRSSRLPLGTSYAPLYTLLILFGWSGILFSLPLGICGCPHLPCERLNSILSNSARTANFANRFRLFAKSVDSEFCSPPTGSSAGGVA